MGWHQLFLRLNVFVIFNGKLSSSATMSINKDMRDAMNTDGKSL